MAKGFLRTCLLFLFGAKKMTILRAGGATTAIIAQAALDNAERFCFTRKASMKTVRKMAAISHQTKGRSTNLGGWDSLQNTINQSDLLVNGTSLGMDGIQFAPAWTDWTAQPDFSCRCYLPTFRNALLKWARNQMSQRSMDLVCCSIREQAFDFGPAR